MRLAMKSAERNFALAALVLVIQSGRDRMVRVVRLDDEVGERQLELMRPEPARVRFWCKAVPVPEEWPDVGGLPDEAPPRLEEWGCKWRACLRGVVHQREHPLLAAPGAGNVDVRRAGFLERQPHEFATTLDRRPIEELVTQGPPPSG